VEICVFGVGIFTLWDLATASIGSIASLYLITDLNFGIDRPHLTSPVVNAILCTLAALGEIPQIIFGILALTQIKSSAPTYWEIGIKRTFALVLVFTIIQALGMLVRLVAAFFSWYYRNGVLELHRYLILSNNVSDPAFVRS